MKIKDLDMHCGECPLIDMCAEPYEFSICCTSCLEEMTTDEYKRKYYEHSGNNEDIYNEICEECG